MCLTADRGRHGEAARAGAVSFRTAAGAAPVWRRLLLHLRQEERPVRWAVARLLWHSGLGALFTMRVGPHRLRFHRSSLSLALWMEPAYGQEDAAVIADILRPGDTAVDVGANVGVTTLACAAAVGPAGRVIAFEPHPRIFSYLKANIALNRCRHVRLLNRAAGDRQGVVPFADGPHDDLNGVQPGGPLCVPMTTLDAELRDVPGRIGLLKVDVEGHEHSVFAGAPATLARTDALYFEVCEAHFRPRGYTTAALLHALAAAGFRFSRRVGAGKEQPLDPSYSPVGCVNVIGRRRAAEPARRRARGEEKHRREEAGAAQPAGGAAPC